MKKQGLLSIYILVAAIFAITASCGDSESRLTPLPADKTTVIIKLDLPPENQSAYENTIWNRLRRIFVHDAIAQTPPATFSSILVTVTGPGMGAVQQSFTPFDTIQFSLPGGNSRQFEVVASVAPGDPSAAASFRGVATADLPEGQTVSLPIAMQLHETKIVVPDYYNNRIVTIGNMSGANFNPITQMGGESILFPYDVSFDSRGRIYIANYSEARGIIRADGADGKNGIAFGTGPVISVAVDRINNILYYAGPTMLFKNTLDGQNEQQLPNVFPPIQFITGIDVYANGMLLIVGTDDSNIPYLMLYDPNADTRTGPFVISQFTSIDLNDPWDVTTSGPFIYVANLGGRSNNQILQFSLDSKNSFILQGSYGAVATKEDTSPGQFYGARRFLAIRNDSLIMADSDSIFFSKLVSISDLAGTGWTTLGTHGTKINEFKLWAVC